jgi:hypothetical protein
MVTVPLSLVNEYVKKARSMAETPAELRAVQEAFVLARAEASYREAVGRRRKRADGWEEEASPSLAKDLAVFHHLKVPEPEDAEVSSWKALILKELDRLCAQGTESMRSP